MIAQSGEAQRTPPQRSPQIGLHTGQVVVFGGDMEGIDHHFGGLIRRQGRQQLTPKLPPALTRQQVVLQPGAQQGAGFAAQALDHMAKVNPPCRHPLVPLAGMEPRQGLQQPPEPVELQPVMAHVHRQLLANQP